MINIKTDSRKVKPGDTFVAIKGLTVDGHDYIEKAIALGATKIVAEHGNYSVDTLIVSDTKKWLQEYVVKNYQDEINKLQIIGVTGTNGKTTTCYLTYQMLRKLGVSAGYMGTIGFFFGDEHYELPNTTPEILDVYSIFIDALERGCTTIIMEVSSHALDQKRVEGIKYTIGAFTNLTEDHLDYHKTMENYLNAKLLLLKQIKEDGLMIINNDDEYANNFKQNNYLTLGYNDADYQIKSYENTLNGTIINFTYQNKSYQVETNLRSKFNVYNYLTAVAIINNLGYSIPEILNLAKEINAPKGRCEQIKVNGGEAVIDYAHTPDAVDKIITAFLENKKGRIITLIGCGGDRDPLKRPIMGEIATRKSDYVIFTSDNPRTEDPEKILQDILKGVNNNNYEVEQDRHKAIEKGLKMLQSNDTLLILGKGHEDYQIIGHTKYHLDDKEEVEKYLNSLKK